MASIITIDRRGSDSNKWRAYPPDVIPLPVADMDFASDPAILAAVSERLEHRVLGYGSATDDLRSTLVEAISSEFDWQIQPEWLVFLPGVEPGFNMALRAFTKPGDTVTQDLPVYKPLRTAPGTWGLKTAPVHLKQGQDGRWTVDETELAEAVTRSSVMLLCNPQNPTGRVYTRAELEKRVEFCLNNSVVLISDEIHAGLTLDGRVHIPAASLSSDIENRSITLMSASKTWNIAGLKAAFAIVPDTEMRRRFVGEKKGLVDSVNVLGLAAMQAAYRDAADWRNAVRARLAENRDFLHSFLAERQPGARSLPAEASFLAWIDLSVFGLNKPAAAWLLENARIGVSPGTDFGPELDGWIRLNFACSMEMLAEAAERMAMALDKR